MSMHTHRRLLTSPRTAKTRRTRLQLHSLEERAVPANFVVTNDNDSGTGSLRDAIAQSNATSGPNTITFDPAFFTTDKVISLTSGLSVTTNALTISNPAGPSQVIIQRASGTFGIFSNSSNLTVDGLTVTGGNSGNGGGFTISAAAAALTVKNSIVANNIGVQGGAIYVPSSYTSLLTVENSLITGNASGTGGIYFFSGGSLLVKNSTITGNIGNSTSTWEGGGIVFYGAVGSSGVTIENSTITNNTSASSTGGGGFSLNNVTGTVTIRNSTITGNTAPTSAQGGAGVGVYQGSPTLNIVSSIIAQNNGPSAKPDLGVANGTATLANSLLGVAAPANVTDNGGNLQGTSGSPLNPQLSALGFYGGLTPTRVPLVGSPVLNVGSNPAGLTNDQRGLVRTFNGTIDMGAVERQAIDAAPSANANLPDITTPAGATYTFQVTFSDDDGATPGINVGSLISNNNAIRVTGPGGYNVLATYVSINNNSNGSPRTVTYSIPAPGGLWDPTDNGNYIASIEGAQVFDLDGIPANAAPLDSFFVDVPVEFVVLNDADSGSGSLREAIDLANADTVPGYITFDPVFFSSPKVISLDTPLATLTTAAGRLVIDGPGANMLTIERSATATGGNFRLFTTNAPVFEIEGVTLQGGFADTANGGAILASNSVVIRNTVLQNNQATGDNFNEGSGGAIALNVGAGLAMQNTAITGNTAQRNGGGIYFYGGGSLLVESSSITGNQITGGTAEFRGGAGIYFYGVAAGNLTVRNSTIANNTSATSGGAILMILANASLDVQNSTISGNSAAVTTVTAYYAYGGGGITEFASNGTINITNSVVSGNTNANGPDVLAASMGVVLTSSLLSSETGFTPTDGGGNLVTGTDPALGTLTSTGGLTQLFVPALSSPLINAGNNTLVPSGLVTDQLGGSHVRIADGTVDIGAFEMQPPSVTVNQAPSQADPTNVPSIVFDIVFSLPVADFVDSDITLTSAVGGTVSLTGSGAVYQATVTGMNGQGNVQLSVAANVATDLTTLGNSASTSTDNTVYFDNAPPSSVISVFTGQSDPTNLAPVIFDVLFDEPVTGFTQSDISFTGSTVSGSLSAVVVSLSTAHYRVDVFGMTSSGDVVISYAAGAALDQFANPSVAPTLTDNVIVYDITPPTVTVEQAATQADPSGGSATSGVTYTVTFSEPVTGLTAGDFSLTGTTAPGATVTNVSGSGAVYTVTVGAMTAGGTIKLSLPANTVTDIAGNNNFASTSADNDVTFILSGTLQFAAPTYTVAENGSQVIVEVSRTGGSEGPLSVNYATGDVSTSAGADYTGDSNSLFWLAGDTTSRFITINILDDSNVEGNEDFNVTLSNVLLAGALGAPSATTVTITDYEEGDITFSAPTYTAVEPDAVNGLATIVIQRLNGGNGAVDVTYNMTLGTAEATDIGTPTPNIVSGTLSWADGDTADKVITIPILMDTISEGYETVNFALTAPTNGAILGASPNAVLTIQPSDPVKINALTNFKALKFTDTDQDTVFVSLGGKTGLLDVYKTDDVMPISVLTTTATDPAKSTVTVTVVKAKKAVNPAADGKVTIGELTGTGLRSFTALKSDIVDSGININGFIGTIKVGNILNGADIVALGLPTQKTVIVAGTIGDNSVINLGSTLQLLSAASVGDSDIVSPRVGSIVVKGAFGADITLAGTGVDHTKFKTMNLLNVGGPITGMDVNITGGIGAIVAKNDLLNSNITAFNLNGMTVLGAMTNTDVTLNGNGVNHAKKAKTLGAVTVKKAVTDSDIVVTGNIGAVTVFGFKNSRLFGGYTGADDGSGTFNLAIPTTISAFKSLPNTKLGLTGAFENSSVIASIISTVVLGAVTENNGGADPFGIFVDSKFGSVSILDTKQKFVGATLPVTGFTDQDFNIKVK